VRIRERWNVLADRHGVGRAAVSDQVRDVVLALWLQLEEEGLDFWAQVDAALHDCRRNGFPWNSGMDLAYLARPLSQHGDPNDTLLARLIAGAFVDKRRQRERHEDERRRERVAGRPIEVPVASPEEIAAANKRAREARAQARATKAQG
jgi:hypothetical protein